MSLKYINKLKDKRVVIVGGTSGIGFAAAEAAVEYGAIVVVASSKPEKVDKAVERIRQSYPDVGDRIRGKTVDLSSDNVEDQIVALFDFATDSGKHKLDHIVDSAGDAFGTVPLSEVTPEKITAPLKVRLTGTLLLAKVSMNYLNISHASSFTTTSGVSDTKPTPGWAIMAPIGAAKKGLTHALANDMKPVRVNCVCPGAIKTEMFDRFGDQFGAERLAQIIEIYKAKTLTGSLGTPEDLAECYICSMKNGFMTGVELYADGGYLLC